MFHMLKFSPANLFFLSNLLSEMGLCILHVRVNPASSSLLFIVRQQDAFLPTDSTVFIHVNLY